MTQLKKAMVVMFSTNEEASIIEDKQGLILYNTAQRLIRPNEGRYIYLISTDPEDKPEENEICVIWDGLSYNVDPFTKEIEKYVTAYKILVTTDINLNGNYSSLSTAKNRVPQPSHSFLKVFVENYNRGVKIQEVMLECEDGKVKVDSKNVVTIRPVKNQYTKEELETEIIKFATWYSGMKEASVRRAYERFKKEIIT